MTTLGPDAARIFRITHVDNIPWILDHGIDARSSTTADPNFVSIGLPELIQKRATRPVPIGPGGNLGDFVPFYFTPWSVMMYNIRTGHQGVIQRPNADIVIMVSSLHRLKELGVPFVFTNGHAYMQESEYFEDMADLSKVDWQLLRSRNFRRDPEDPGKLGRYQAEALAHKNVPVEALLGIACYDTDVSGNVRGEVDARELSIDVRALPRWYF